MLQDLLNAAAAAAAAAAGSLLQLVGSIKEN
jgi:hypothetical protein